MLYQFYFIRLLDTTDSRLVDRVVWNTHCGIHTVWNTHTSTRVVMQLNWIIKFKLILKKKLNSGETEEEKKSEIDNLNCVNQFT